MLDSERTSQSSLNQMQWVESTARFLGVDALCFGALALAPFLLLWITK